MGLTAREQLLLMALALAGAALLAALISTAVLRYRFKKRLARHAQELRSAFAEAYVGMRDAAVDVRRVRTAERLLESVIEDLQHFI